jgi:hypothetical protein
MDRGRYHLPVLRLRTQVGATRVRSARQRHPDHAVAHRAANALSCRRPDKPSGRRGSQRFRGNQRKRKFVKRFRNVISGGRSGVFAVNWGRSPRSAGRYWVRACRGSALAREPGGGVRRCARSRPGAPALDVVQAGLGSLQRSTGLVRGPGRGRGSCPGFPARWSSTSRRARSPRGEMAWGGRAAAAGLCRVRPGLGAVMRSSRGDGRARRRRSGRPSGCRARSATRSTAAATRRRPRGPAPA